MKFPILIKTANGISLYKEMNRGFHEAKEKSNFSDYLATVIAKYSEISKEMSFFLSDKEMTKQYKLDEEDALGWKYYTELYDKYSIMSFFMKQVRQHAK